MQRYYKERGKTMTNQAKHVSEVFFHLGVLQLGVQIQVLAGHTNLPAVCLAAVTIGRAGAVCRAAICGIAVYGVTAGEAAAAGPVDQREPARGRLCRMHRYLWKDANAAAVHVCRRNGGADLQASRASSAKRLV